MAKKALPCSAMPVSIAERRLKVISDEQLETLKATLLGSCAMLDPVLERLDIDASVEEAEDRLLDGAMAVECCAGCGWWHESAVMEISDELQAPVCRDCEPELFQ